MVGNVVHWENACSAHKKAQFLLLISLGEEKKNISMCVYLTFKNLICSWL